MNGFLNRITYFFVKIDQNKMKQMSEFWNERYAVKEYVYGTDPNQFFKRHLEKLTPGSILFPAEERRT